MNHTSLKTSAEIQASLQKPGAGIPFNLRLFNLFILKPFKIKRAGWEECQIQFQSAHDKVKEVLQSLVPEELITRVLIPPQKGLEDSSRYWSVAMTAKHLAIVGQGMEKVIIALSHGQSIPIKVDTAKVKPEEQPDGLVAVNEYIRFGDGVLQRIHQGIGRQDSETTHSHPWFGALTAKDWLWLMGFHTKIHYEQIKKIQEGLG